MSTTITFDDKECASGVGDGSAPVKKSRYMRRKIEILFAYYGVGYQDMQNNPGAKTIEGDLEEALYQTGGVPDHDKCQPKKYVWACSAHTDKGISAMGQVVWVTYVLCLQVRAVIKGRVSSLCTSLFNYGALNFCVRQHTTGLAITICLLVDVDLSHLSRLYQLLDLPIGKCRLCSTPIKLKSV